MDCFSEIKSKSPKRASSHKQSAIVSGHSYRLNLRRKNLLRLVASTVIGGVSLVGCSVSGRKYDRIPHEADHHYLRTIEEVQTDYYASTTPITVEEAAKKIAEQVSRQQESPEKISVTLADVRAAALGNNLDLRVELLNPAITAQNIGIATGRFDAVLGMSVNRLHLDTPTVFPPAYPVPENQFNAHNTEVDLILPNRTGGTFQISRLVDAGHVDGDPEIYDSDWRFSISQPLLRGAGVAVNTAAIRIAKYSTLQADALSRLEVISVLADSERQFWNVWAARKEFEIRQQQLELAEKQLVDIKKYVKSEAKAGSEINRADAGIAQRVEAIIFAEANLRIQERELKRIVNWSDVPLESRTVIEPISEPELVGYELDELALVAMAIQNRPELQFQNYQLANDEIQIAVAKNSRLPSLTLTASATVNGIGNSLGQANEVLRHGHYDDFNGGLTLLFPVPNQTARALEQQRRLQRMQTCATRDQLAQRITQQVFDASTLFQQNWKRILAARNNVRFATKVLQDEEKLFEAGEQNRTTTEVLNAAAQVASAQSAEARAIADYQISRIDVVFATGTLLGYGQVHWEQNPARRAVIEGAVIEGAVIEGAAVDSLNMESSVIDQPVVFD